MPGSIVILENSKYDFAQYIQLHLVIKSLKYTTRLLLHSWVVLNNKTMYKKATFLFCLFILSIASYGQKFNAGINLEGGFSSTTNQLKRLEKENAPFFAIGGRVSYPILQSRFSIESGISYYQKLFNLRSNDSRIEYDFENGLGASQGTNIFQKISNDGIVVPLYITSHISKFTIGVGGKYWYSFLKGKHFKKSGAITEYGSGTRVETYSIVYFPKDYFTLSGMLGYKIQYFEFRVNFDLAFKPLLYCDYKALLNDELFVDDHMSSKMNLVSIQVIYSPDFRNKERTRSKDRGSIKDFFKKLYL